jgi:hypothetical protein
MADKGPEKDVRKVDQPKADNLFSNPNILDELLQDLNDYEKWSGTDNIYQSDKSGRVDVEKHEPYEDAEKAKKVAYEFQPKPSWMENPTPAAGGTGGISDAYHPADRALSRETPFGDEVKSVNPPAPKKPSLFEKLIVHPFDKAVDAFVPPPGPPKEKPKPFVPPAPYADPLKNLKTPKSASQDPQVKKKVDNLEEDLLKSILENYEDYEKYLGVADMSLPSAKDKLVDTEEFPMDTKTRIAAPRIRRVGPDGGTTKCKSCGKIEKNHYVTYDSKADVYSKPYCNKEDIYD